MRGVVLLILCACLGGTLGLAAPPPRPGLDGGPITVSGVSSGAFMANQFHVAHSSRVDGAGLVAGGLYACAVSAPRGTGAMATASRALAHCMKQTNLLEPPERFIGLLRHFASDGAIDDPKGLIGDRVYLFSGRGDHVVGTATVETAAAVLRALGAETTLLTALPDTEDPDRRAGHAFLTVDRGGPCAAEAPPYVNDCDYDQARAILETVLGAPLNPPTEGDPTGTLHAFDQGPFIPDGKTPLQVALWDRGLVYVPKACEADTAACRLHVAFHGCLQSDQILGDGAGSFAALAGFHRWADTNALVILYPQARSTTIADGIYPTEINPNGCWNWWGYASDGDYLHKGGDQIRAIKAMVDFLEDH
jgi:hypothetical protein